MFWAGEIKMSKYNPKGKKSIGYHEYTSEEIAEEIKRFQRKGGLIKKLPDTTEPSRNMIFPSRPENAHPYEIPGQIQGRGKVGE